jgi:hypothetical protein
MKIALLTYPLNNNYGNLLQAYALMTVLKRVGHDVWFIDLQRYPLQRDILSTHLAFLKKNVKKYILRREVFSIIPSKDDRNRELENIITWQYTRPFVDKYLCPKISPIYSSEELITIIDKFNFDAFIVGSDQIWRPKYMRNFKKTTYFDFLKDRKVKRLSYAASFGTDEWEYTPKLTKECAELIKAFSAVSVREDSGVILCKKHFGVDAQWVLDPTMLLDKENYINLIEIAQIKQRSEDLFCYILDKTSEKQKIIDTVSKQLTLTPFYMGIKQDEKKIENKIFEPVETWLRGFYDAKFVITDSFHGMVFSIIFNKPFLCYINEERGKARFESLAKQFGLEEQLVSLGNDFSIDKINNVVNWTRINEQIDKRQKDSLDFLINVLQ